MTETAKWYEKAGNCGDVVISTRVRLARNLKQYPFPARATDKQREAVEQKVKDALLSGNSILSKEFRFLPLESASEEEAVSLVERHIVSPEFISDRRGKAVLISEDESISIMINEEDHLRIQVLREGLSLKEAAETADRIDTLLSETLDFAYDSEFGYLTQCPTNLGTGLRASVMLHLPALTEMCIRDRARALMHSPKVLLVDDSAGGLDQETAQATRELLTYVAAEEGVTLFLCSSNMHFAQRLCRNFAILRQGVLLARGDLESLRTGAGVGYRACLRLGEGSPAPAGFHWNDGFWEREIESQEDMPKIISRAVGAGARLYEARLDRPTLKEIYAAWLEGGRRKVKESHGTADETPTDGSFWQPGEDEPAALPGEEPPEPAPGQGAPEEGVGEEV